MATGAVDDPAPAAAGQRVLALLNKAIDIQSPLVRRNIARARHRNPDATPAQVIRSLERMYVSAVTGTGAAVGRAAAAPVPGRESRWRCQPARPSPPWSSAPRSPTEETPPTSENPPDRPAGARTRRGSALPEVVPVPTRHVAGAPDPTAADPHLDEPVPGGRVVADGVRVVGAAVGQWPPTAASGPDVHDDPVAGPGPHTGPPRPGERRHRRPRHRGRVRP